MVKLVKTKTFQKHCGKRNYHFVQVNIKQREVFFSFCIFSLHLGSENIVGNGIFILFRWTQSGGRPFCLLVLCLLFCLSFLYFHLGSKNIVGKWNYHFVQVNTKWREASGGLLSQLKSGARLTYFPQRTNCICLIAKVKCFLQRKRTNCICSFAKVTYFQQRTNCIFFFCFQSHVFLTKENCICLFAKGTYFQ